MSANEDLDSKKSDPMSFNEKATQEVQGSKDLQSSVNQESFGLQQIISHNISDVSLFHDRSIGNNAGKMKDQDVGFIISTNKVDCNQQGLDLSQKGLNLEPKESTQIKKKKKNQENTNEEQGFSNKMNINQDKHRQDDDVQEAKSGDKTMRGVEGNFKNEVNNQIMYEALKEPQHNVKKNTACIAEGGCEKEENSMFKLSKSKEQHQQMNQAMERNVTEESQQKIVPQVEKIEIEKPFHKQEEKGEEIEMKEISAKKKKSKRESSRVYEHRTNSRSNSENNRSDSQGEEKLKIVRRDTEKKRGIRDLSTDEKWGVYADYAEMQSLRGVGRLYNMDHSTVKLLIQRINNERPGETMTKELFMTTSLAQPAYEQPLVKKNKKELKSEEQQMNKKEKKLKKNNYGDSQGEESDEGQGNIGTEEFNENNVFEMQTRTSSDLPKTKKTSKYIAKKHKTLEHYASAYDNANINNGYTEYAPQQGESEIPLNFVQHNQDQSQIVQAFDQQGQQEGGNDKQTLRKSKSKNEEIPKISKKNKAKSAMQFFHEGQIHLSDPDSPQIHTQQQTQAQSTANTKSGFDEHHFLDNYELLTQINPDNNLFFGQQIHLQDHSGNKEDYDINFEHFDFTSNSIHNQQHQQHNNQSQYDEIKLDLP